jgi:hypothetical protein
MKITADPSPMFAIEKKSFFRLMEKSLKAPREQGE